MTKWCYFFGKAPDGSNLTEGNAKMKELLGGKGANLAEMATIGLPVPPGFTVTTEACRAYDEGGQKWPDGLAEEFEQYIQKLEGVTGKKLGDPANPLLVSVRSGAAASMPGMMDTVLNLGLNDNSVEGLIARTGNPRFAWDCYRRFIDMFGDVVAGVDHEHFEEVIHAMKEKKGVKYDTELTADDLAELCKRYKDVYRKHKGEHFPQNPRTQLELAVNAVFGSWNSDAPSSTARSTRSRGLIGTAVNVCTMVFGNMGETAAPACASPATPPPARRSSTASS